MAVRDHRLSNRPGADPSGVPVLPIEGTPSRRQLRRERRAGRPKLRKLRLIVVLGGFITIAGIAMLFGMLTAVASDLHGLSNQVQYQENVDSVLYDDTGQEIGTLAPPDKSVIDRFQQISPNMDNAIVSVEDHGFWSEPGIDLTSIARAALSDVTGGPKEGASTIAEEFVKNAEAEEGNRTVLEKLREAGIAFQLTHRWKRKKILDQYLNIIYFGNGAYGVEAAARTYFGKQLGFDPSDPGAGRCGTPTVTRPHMPTCASLLRPYQAALLAGMVANPSAFDPIAHPQAALGRRQLVLADMVRYHDISHAAADHANAQPLPREKDIQQASEPAAAPFFTAWVRPLIVRSLEKEGVSPDHAQYEAYYGGLKIKLTLNLKMQEAAQQAVDAYFPSEKDSPTATLVSIDNANGEVRAMVSGDGDYQADPFNLATLGYRQPGSSFKLFTLVKALESGAYSPSSVIDSEPLDIPFKGPYGEQEHFIVHNDEDSYLGPISLQAATDVSDNSVFAQVGMALGTKNIAKEAKLMGIRTPVSTNPAMIIGGLTHGVSALDMAHAYETIATGGKKVYNPVLGDYEQGAIGIHSILNCKPCQQKNVVNKPVRKQDVPPDVAETVQEMLEGVISHGTGMNAAIPGYVVAGKTGTTSSYVDAWFCGWTTQLTTCVWVGYPNTDKQMSTLYNGGPVVGGSFPALIWKDYMEQALAIVADQGTGTSTSVSTTPIVSGTPSTSGASGSTGNTGAAGGTGAGNTGNTGAGPGATGNQGATAAPATGAGNGGGVVSTPATAPAPVESTPAAAPPAASSGTGASSGSTGSGATGGAGLGG
jgi:penicillin-binding protein 1A